MGTIIGIILLLVGAGVVTDKFWPTRTKVIGYLIGGIGMFLLIRGCV